jgi:squalene synthase HpnC
LTDPTLAAADAYCRALTKTHYENFIVASGLLNGDRRRDLSRVYAFCRTTDDLGDESDSPAAALERLERWETEVRALFSGATPVNPVLLALRETLKRVPMPAELFLDLIEANVQDQRVVRYATWPQLEAYCKLSAAPVGRMVLAVFGVADRRAASLSDDVCIGLQLANHAQDVKRDAEIGRRYLIDEDVAAAGVPGAVRALVQRARPLLDAGRTLEPLVPLALRLQLSFYRMGGLAICDAIERLDFRTDLSRPTVSDRDKTQILLRGLFGALRPSGNGTYVGST